MKIKKLTIRNIASIEKADIDFENDLNEAFTNNPSPIFLITGDTGAGKSVILDAIAMALYKTTPRISGVSDPKNNKFINAAGEEVGLNSIEQYTRQGIAPKEDCYSELVFEGNDGKSYTARLSLGIYLGNTESDGKRRIKYETPKWKLTVDGHEYSKIKDIEDKVQEAVGLNFEQFSRMAMLAQGQFAAFLTGSKKERETILERLTNTEHFSDYGAAIASLFSNAEGLRKECEKIYKTQCEHTLPENTLTELQEEKGDKEKQKDQLGKQIEMLGKQIDQLKRIESNKTIQEEAKTRLTKLEDITALKATFTTLASDLVDRERQLAALNDDIAKDERWLDERKEQDELYSKVGEYLLQINQLKDKAAEIDVLASKKKAAEGQIDTLKNALASAIEQAEKAKQAVVNKQNEIDRKIKEREALLPDEIHKKIEQLGEEKGKLEKLQGDIQQYNDAYIKLKELLAKIEEDKKKLVSLQEEMTQKGEAFKKAKETYESANSQYVTIGSSVQDTLVALRQRLAEEHAKTCPLCGQDIEHELLSTDDFQQIITPYEEKKNSCKKAMDDAEKEYTAAKTAHDTFKGSVDSKINQSTQQQKDNIIEHQRIVDVADSLHLDREQKYPAQIEQRLQTIKTETDKLSESWNKAEELQKAIKLLLDEKKPLETAKSNADITQQKAQTAFDENGKFIVDCDTKTAEAKTKMDELVAILSAVLQPVYPHWADDLEATKTQLNKAAQEYKTMKSQRDSKATQAQQTKVLHDNIRNIKGNLTEKHPEWNVAYNSVAHPSNDILKEWSTLMADVSQNLSDIASQHTAIANAQNTINDTLAELKVEKEEDLPDKTALENQQKGLDEQKNEIVERLGAIQSQLDENKRNLEKVGQAKNKLEQAQETSKKWGILNKYFGGPRFRTLVQTYVLRPLLGNANIYLQQITDRYRLTCSEDNEQLSILVYDNYSKQVRSATLLSGGERFMISLALSLGLSSLNRAGLNANILFIDEGFGTLDENSLDSVMATLEKLQDIAGLKERRVGIISHRSELEERIPVQIRVEKKGEGRSQVVITNS